MVKKYQETPRYTYGICDLQYGKSARLLPCDQFVELTEQLCHVHVVIKCHDGEGSPEKGHRRDKRSFHDMPCLWRRLLVLIGHDDICFPHVLYLEPRVFLMDPLNDPQDRDDAPLLSWFCKLYDP